MSGKGRSPCKKKYKRTKRIFKHPNKLFEKWLKEWQDEAASRQSNMRHNFHRARKSLKLYPLPLYTGKDCKVLAHFGDKICQMIDKRLEEHIQENGPVNWDEIHQVEEEPQKKKRVRKKSANVRTAECGEVEPATSNPKPQISKQGASPKRRRSRSYVPAPRSGAYGLLMALYNASKAEDYPGYIGKKDLMEAAAPLCDVSFKHSAEGSHYTAWSSMTTLTKKGLVTREGSPARYSLTAEGKALAAQIASAESGVNITSPIKTFLPVKPVEEVIELSSRSCSPVLVDKNSPDISLDDFEGVCSILDTNGDKANKGDGIDTTHTVKRKKDEDDCNPARKMSKTLTSSERNALSKDFGASSSGNFGYSYITSLEMETPMRSRAVISVEEDGFLGYLVKCQHSDLISSGLAYRLDKCRTAPPGYIYAYLSSECAPNMCPGLRSPTRPKANSPRASKPLAKQPFGTLFSKITGKDSNSQAAASLDPLSSKEANRPPAATTKISHSALTENQKRIDSYVTKTTGEASKPLYSLFPGQFDVLLCVDNCEISGGFTGGKSSTKEIIITELDKHGIMYDVRKLHVGDFLWVCLERNPVNGERRELVLPYIVERKRMDDLASSIRDGRFREQKFRLKQSGLSKPIYLVEEYGSKHLSLPESTCLQAVINTQVVDEFTVKTVKDQRESAAYLTIMTRCLQSMYKDKILKAVPREQFKQVSPSFESHGNIETSLMNFSEFNSSSVKNRQLEVREMFAKHLLQIHGLSVDKARAIVDKFGTPSQLIDAYERVSGASEGENLLATLKCGKAGRNLGTGLSATIYKMYSSRSLR